MSARPGWLPGATTHSTAPSLAADPWTIAALLAIALTVRAFLALQVTAPWIMIDELVYSELAKSFASTGDLLIRGQDSLTYSVLYPVLISPAWLANSMQATYVAAKVINAALVTLAAIPFYIWARRLVPPGHALVAVALFLIMPALLYTGALMTENAFLPAFVGAGFLFALALERPTVASQMLALAATAVAVAVRLQGLVLIPILLTAIVAMASVEWRGAGREAALAYLRRFWPTGAGVVIAAAAYAVATIAQDARPGQFLGAYQIVAETDYSATESAQWVLRHFGELGFSVGVIPACAFVLLCVSTWRGQLLRSKAERAFVAVTAASVVWLPLQSGVFASRFAGRIEERTMLYVQPLLVLALVVWVARGTARPRLATAVAVAVPAALMLTLPFARLLGPQVTSDTFALVPLLVAREHMGLAAAEALVWIGIAAAGALFAFTPQRHVALLLFGAVAAFFAVTSGVVAHRVEQAARGTAATPLVGSEFSWVDRAIGRDGAAGFLYTPGVEGHALWQTEFWNESVGTVFELGGGEQGGLPHVDASVNGRTGKIATTGPVPPFVIASGTVSVVGETIASRGPWQIYRVARPLRLGSTVAGLHADGWMGAEATYTAYAAGSIAPSWVAVVLSRPWGEPGTRSRVRIDARRLGAARTTASRSGFLPAFGELTFVVPVPPRPFEIRVAVHPTFTPADVGFADRRQLGARLSFEPLMGR